MDWQSLTTSVAALFLLPALPVAEELYRLDEDHPAAGKGIELPLNDFLSEDSFAQP